jgi:hypothetical protein
VIGGMTLIHHDWSEFWHCEGVGIGDYKFKNLIHFFCHRIENIRSCSLSNHGPVNEPFPVLESSVPGAKILTPRKCVSFPF